MGTVSAAGAVAAMGDIDAFASPISDVRKLSAEHFRPMIGQTFRFRAGEEQINLNLKLTEVESLPRRDLPSQFRTPLSLLFVGGTKESPRQMAGRLGNIQFGSFDTMVVAIEHAGDELVYQVLLS